MLHSPIPGLCLTGGPSRNPPLDNSTPTCARMHTGDSHGLHVCTLPPSCPLRPGPGTLTHTYTLPMHSCPTHTPAHVFLSAQPVLALGLSASPHQPWATGCSLLPLPTQPSWSQGQGTAG